MFQSLYARLALALTLLFALVGLSFVGLMIYSATMIEQETTQRLHRELAANIVGEQLLFKDGRLDHTALEHSFHTMMVINPSVELYLLDPAGNILAFSAPPQKVKRKRVDLKPVHRFIAGENGMPLVGDDPRDLQRRKVFSAAAVEDQGVLRGYLYVIVGGEQYDSITQRLKNSYIVKASLWVAVAGTVFALLAGLLVFALLTSRLRHLAGEMSRFRDSGFSASTQAVVADGPAQDEIGQLAVTFQAMTDRIRSQMAQLKQTDTLRRELVANVSHDLRTPLASLHGYLETLLLKHEQLSESEQLDYLETATRHSQRLGQLVSELFELAKLDSNQTQPRLEPFPLAELVADIVQKFQLKAREQKVSLTLQGIADIPFVTADIGLIERVLENLIDNALRYTPSGGQITLRLVPGQDKVTVQVADTGCGIAEQELPNIFDRFYRARNVPPQERGSGLGLAIAKRILELHGSIIQATSALDVGTTFTFQLPTAHSHQPESTPAT